MPPPHPPPHQGTPPCGSLRRLLPVLHGQGGRPSDLRQARHRDSSDCTAVQAMAALAAAARRKAPTTLPRPGPPAAIGRGKKAVADAPPSPTRRSRRSQLAAPPPPSRPTNSSGCNENIARCGVGFGRKRQSIPGHSVATASGHLRSKSPSTSAGSGPVRPESAQVRPKSATSGASSTPFRPNWANGAQLRPNMWLRFVLAVAP